MDAPLVSLPKQRNFLVMKWSGLLGLIFLDYTTCYDAERRDHADATSFSLSCYTQTFLSQHLARSTTRTKIQVWCKIATSLLPYRRLLLERLTPILLAWIQVSWADDVPISRLLSVATVALRVAWGLFALRYVWRVFQYGPPTLQDCNTGIGEMLRGLILHLALQC
jgi:hypothetical protein